jgi:hypothetical protein
VIEVADEPADGLPAAATLVIPSYSLIILSQDTVEDPSRS